MSFEDISFQAWIAQTHCSNIGLTFPIFWYGRECNWGECLFHWLQTIKERTIFQQMYWHTAIKVILVPLQTRYILPTLQKQVGKHIQPHICRRNTSVPNCNYRTSLSKTVSISSKSLNYKTPLAQIKEGQMPELPYQVLTFTLFPPANTFPLHFYTHLWREEDTPLHCVCVGGGYNYVWVKTKPLCF